MPSCSLVLDLGTGRCGPEPELSWPDFKVAILADNQLEDRRAFESQGWKVFVHPLDSDEVTSVIRLRMTEVVNQEDQ